MHLHQISIYLGGPEATDDLAKAIAPMLLPGDSILLSGPVGAGKSQFARAVVRFHMGSEEEVPSPSFTLVQTYPAERFDIWHADLYRLTNPSDLEELGILEALDSCVALIEWPDRMGPLAPANALHVNLSYSGDGRVAEVRSMAHGRIFNALSQGYQHEPTTSV